MHHVLFFQKYVGEVFNIISQQSTARPGCIIELDAITDFVRIRSTTKPEYHVISHSAQRSPGLSLFVQQGKETQLLHVFEEDLILGNEKSDDCLQESGRRSFSLITQQCWLCFCAVS